MGNRKEFIIENIGIGLIMILVNFFSTNKLVADIIIAVLALILAILTYKRFILPRKRVSYYNYALMGYMIVFVDFIAYGVVDFIKDTKPNANLALLAINIFLAFLAVKYIKIVKGVAKEEGIALTWN